jgi:peptide/nickel transport system substrate-binding protein
MADGGGRTGLSAGPLFKARLPKVLLPKVLLLARLLLTGLLLTGVATAETPFSSSLERASGQPAPLQLTVGGTVFPPRFHPMLESTTAQSWVLGLVFRSLIAVDRDARMICLSCTEVPSLENGRIRQVVRANGRPGADVTFTLRDDMFWGDGTPVSSRDVELALRIGREAAVQATTPDLFHNDILGITILDERNFTIHRAYAGCSLIALKELHPLPSHLEGPIFAASPAQYLQQSLYVTAPETPGLWNGPYRLRSLEPGVVVSMDRNPAWRGPRPMLDRIGFRGFATTTALESAFLAGRVDALPGETGLRVDQARALAARADGRYRLVIQPALVHEHLDVNHANPMLADLRVRQGLLTALDRVALTDSVLGGNVIISSSDIAPADPVFSKVPPPVVFDPVGAGALLDSAGWKRGADGRRRNADGQAMVIDLVTTAGHRERELVMDFIQRSWERLGITVRVASEPAKVLYLKTQPERRFPGMVLFSWRTPPASTRRSKLHSSAIPTQANYFSGQNYGGYQDAEMDRLIEAQENACGPGEQDLWDAYQQHYAATLPAIPLFFWSDAALLPPWLEGAEPLGQQFPATLFVERWRVTGPVPPGQVPLP